MAVMNPVRRSLNKDKIVYRAQNILQKNLLYIGNNNSVPVRKYILKILHLSYHLSLRSVGEMYGTGPGADKTAETTFMEEFNRR
jgi:hypothetical protein